ncbi:hypothetical protein [Vreelandella sp. H-I2]
MPDIDEQRSDRLGKIGNDLEGNGKEDKAAQEENREFQSGNLRRATDKSLLEANDHRNETTRDVFHKLFIIGLRVVGTSLILIFLVRVVHIIMPEQLHWLSSKNIQEIDRMFFSGAIGGVIIKYLEPILNGKSKK